VNKIKGRKLWLVAEHGEARDNGYHFYKYVREQHPEDYCFYAIKVDDPGYEKVAKLGNVIKYGSLKHWLYYMSADLNISSQKSGNPSPVFFGFVHTILGLYNRRVFLQHGITQNDVKFVYYNRSKFKYFLCGAKQEYEFVKKEFGYPDGAVILTGFARWDNLKEARGDKKGKTILVMPTWRNWLGGEKNAVFKTRDFKETDFYKHWNDFLNNEEFVNYIEENKIKVYFYPHYGMQKYIDAFKMISKNIEIVTLDQDIQEFFSKCDLMITDYSSVAFDFAYLEKPIVYYQFDKKEFRERQYAEGYFKYERDGFGPVCETLPELLKAMKSKPKKEYAIREKEFFGFHDDKNCERIYEAIK
jgi:CDP-glycerol glycerophosphotransferase (TagB/SpsB family)